ncbi:hypothetical protein OAM96_05755, partial [Candidatus Poseidoniaceae archaeon]|nr:hypothetical protein [Candidatus Poseidoniaceae archaeon]
HVKWELDLDSMEFILSVFTAYNKHANVQSKWSWPEDIEDISTSLKSDGELTPSLKEEWINFAQFISENESISIDENTFTVIGKHGSMFRFDASIEHSRWLPPNSLSSHATALGNIKRGARNKHILDNHIANLEASSASWKIETSSEDESLVFHDFPAHMTGLELKQYEGYSTCVFPSGDSFIESLSLLLKLLLEDEEIWNLLHQQEIDRREFNEEFNRKWPNGRPEDWMYL